jgi:hypothetical protein
MLISRCFAGMILQPPQALEDPQEEDFSFENKGIMMENSRSGDKDGPRLSKFTSSSTAALTPRLLGEAVGERNESPPAVAMINLILNMVWRKLVRNPNTYASVIGISWALTSYRHDFLQKDFYLIFSSSSVGLVKQLCCSFVYLFSIPCFYFSKQIDKQKQEHNVTE